MKFALRLATFALASSMSSLVMASNDQDTIDIAQLEALGEAATEYVEVKEVIKRGKPPYRRVTTRMPVYDVAQLELLEDEDKPKLKGNRPPFKRHK